MTTNGAVCTEPDRRYTACVSARGVNRSSIALFLAALVPLLSCGALLVYGSGRGLDLTDEIFYLVWARNPNAYALLYQPFGYLLHPLFELVRGDLQAYRLAGFTLAAGAGVFVGASLPSARGNRAAFMAYGAASALTIFFPWIITPSYNSAANVGGMLIIGGLLNTLRDRTATRVIGSLAAGAGLCIAAFAKPPLFGISVGVILVTAILGRSVRPALGLMLSLLVAVMLISLFVPLPELPGLVRRIILSQHLLALPNTALALPGKIARDWLTVPLPLIGAAAAAVISFVLRRSSWFKWAAYAGIALSLYYVASVTSDAIDGSVPDFLGLAVETTALSYAALLQHERRASLLAVTLLLGAPVAVALGTFNNQWFQLNFSMAFPFLAVFTLASTDTSAWRRGAAQLFAILGPIAAMMLAAWSPYSLPAPIFEQQTPIRAVLASGSIRVDDETAAFVGSARGLARGALVIDLSGTGPGVAAALGGHAPVLPWLNPATPTWPEVVWSRLSARERQEAWFVAPVWPSFRKSAPARWLLAHKASFCPIALPETPFWGQERVLEVWHPCEKGSRERGA